MAQCGAADTSKVRGSNVDWLEEDVLAELELGELVTGAAEAVRSSLFSMVLVSSAESGERNVTY